MTSEHEDKARELRVAISQRKGFKKKEKKLKKHFKDLKDQNGDPVLKDGPNRFGTEVLHARTKTYKSLDKDKLIRRLCAEIGLGKLVDLGVLEHDPADGATFHPDLFSESESVSIWKAERATKDGA